MSDGITLKDLSPEPGKTLACLFGEVHGELDSPRREPVGKILFKRVAPPAANVENWSRRSESLEKRFQLPPSKNLATKACDLSAEYCRNRRRGSTSSGFIHRCFLPCKFAFEFCDIRRVHEINETAILARLNHPRIT